MYGQIKYVFISNLTEVTRVNTNFYLLPANIRVIKIYLRRTQLKVKKKKQETTTVFVIYNRTIYYSIGINPT